MLRFPYLLSLLLCIELSFCYNYIDEVTKHKINKLERNLRREKARWARRQNVRKNPIRREEDYDRSPVEFDVASFIQPDEGIGLDSETNQAYKRHRSNRRTWTSKPFDLGSVLKNDDSNNKMEMTPDYMRMGPNLPELNMSPPLSKDLMSAKHFVYNPLEELNDGKYGHEKFRKMYKDDLLMSNAIHSQEKKCSSLKTIKFPFFSHNKSETLKPKKTKKRKLFFFKKPAAKFDFNKMNDDITTSYRMRRSYEHRLCPACKKIFQDIIDYDRPKKYPTQIIHNSRQFYQNTLPDATLKEEIKDYRTKKISYSPDTYRKKREYESDRQLKELEEVQRKIDAVEIQLPHFEKPSYKNIVFKSSVTAVTIA